MRRLRDIATRVRHCGRQAWRFSATAAMAALAPLTASAGPPCPAEPIRFGLYEYGVFFMPPDRGIDYELARALEQRSGCRFDLPVLSRTLIWRQLQAGTLDMTASALETEQRRQFSHFIILHNQKNFLVVRKAHAPRPATLDDIRKDPTLHFGVVRGYQFSPALTRLLAELRDAGRIDDVADQDMLFKRLANGRYNAVFATPTSYVRYLAEFRLNDEVAVIDVLPEEKPLPSGLALAKRRFTLAEVAAWQALVDEMRRDGALTEIFGRYLPPPIAKSMLAIDPPPKARGARR